MKRSASRTSRGLKNSCMAVPTERFQWPFSRERRRRSEATSHLAWVEGLAAVRAQLVGALVLEVVVVLAPPLARRREERREHARLARAERLERGEQRLVARLRSASGSFEKPCVNDMPWQRDPSRATVPEARARARACAHTHTFHTHQLPPAHTRRSYVRDTPEGSLLGGVCRRKNTAPRLSPGSRALPRATTDRRKNKKWEEGKGK